MVIKVRYFLFIPFHLKKSVVTATLIRSTQCHSRSQARKGCIKIGPSCIRSIKRRALSGSARSTTQCLKNRCSKRYRQAAVTARVRAYIVAVRIPGGQLRLTHRLFLGKKGRMRKTLYPLVQWLTLGHIRCYFRGVN